MAENFAKEIATIESGSSVSKAVLQKKCFGESTGTDDDGLVAKLVSQLTEYSETRPTS